MNTNIALRNLLEYPFPGAERQSVSGITLQKPDSSKRKHTAAL